MNNENVPANVNLRKTNGGKLMAETKTDAVKLFRSIFSNGMINTKILSESEFSNENLYNYFDGVEDAQKKVFGDSVDYECHCGKEFGNKGALEYHRSACSEERQQSVGKVERLLRGRNQESEYAVYVLRIETSNRNEYWYVGMSKRLKNRLVKHDNQTGGRSGIQIPEDGKLVRRSDYSVEEIVEVNHVASKAEAKELERRRAFELCMKYETTDILGGK